MMMTTVTRVRMIASAHKYQIFSVHRCITQWIVSSGYGWSLTGQGKPPIASLFRRPTAAVKLQLPGFDPGASSVHPKDGLHANWSQLHSLHLNLPSSMKVVYVSSSQSRSFLSGSFNLDRSQHANDKRPQERRGVYDTVPQRACFSVFPCTCIDVFSFHALFSTAGCHRITIH